MLYRYTKGAQAYLSLQCYFAGGPLDLDPALDRSGISSQGSHQVHAFTHDTARKYL